MTAPAVPHGVAVVIGAHGGLGSALYQLLRSEKQHAYVLGLARHGGAGGGAGAGSGDLGRAADATDIASTDAAIDAIDITNEASIATAAARVADLLQAAAPLRLVIDATGFLHGHGFEPEKSWRQLDAAHMAHSFAVNAIGPALLMKHFLPLLPRQGKAVFATLSAKVGSIGDNRLGGWYSYRAAKAALNQLVHTAAIELARSKPEAICVALHPGTVDTGLSSPFAKTGLDVQTPAASAARLLAVTNALSASASGGFFNQHGEALPW